MSSTKDFDIFIGVDQTGAVSKGVPKKLPVAVIIKENKESVYYNENLDKNPLYIDSFNKKSFDSLLNSLKINKNNRRVFISVDCVFGFSKNVLKSKNPLSFLIDCFKKASKHDGFGLKAGENYFKSLQQKYEILESDFLREQEKEMSCLSVFKNKPFQKNVQTGTYRIWKDLGTDNAYKKFSFWPYEDDDSKYTVCEAYPFFCRKVLQDVYDDKILFETKDHEDAHLIALYAYVFDVRFPMGFEEGFILS